MFLRSTFLLLVSVSTASVIPFLSTSQSSLTVQDTQTPTSKISYNLKRQTHENGRGSGRRQLLGRQLDPNRNVGFYT